MIKPTDRTLQLPTLEQATLDTKTIKAGRQTYSQPKALSPGVNKIYYQNGLLREILTIENGKLEGNRQVFDPQGMLIREVSYKEGKPHGWRRSYREGGNLEKEFFYQNGRKEGEARVYYPDKNLMAIESYRNGKRHGMRISYYKEGKQRSRTLFENGKLIFRKKYYPNGLLWSHESLAEEVDLSTTRFYYETGEIMAEIRYLKGRPVMLKRYSRGGELIRMTDQEKEILESERFFQLVFEKTAAAQLAPSR